MKTTVQRLRLAVLGTVSAVLVSACAIGPRIDARGEVAGRAVATTVDNDVARDYLAGRPLPATLQARRSIHLARGTVPSREVLAAVSDEFSPDVATLLFAETVGAQPENAEIQREYERAIRAADAPRIPKQLRSSLEIVFVPGWFYRTHSENGGDFRQQREQLSALGFRTRLVMTPENGTVEDNAAAVADDLRSRLGHGRRVVVVSASKSGAEVAVALGSLLEPAESQHVVAWVSIGGVVRGSPLADTALKPVVCGVVKSKFASEGFDLEGLKSLRTEPRRASAKTMELPRHLLRVSYIGVPLSGDVGDEARFTYGRLRDDGPNDGLTLLSDELIPGGYAVLEPGSDHYFNAPGQPQRTLALLSVVLRRIQEQSA